MREEFEQYIVNLYKGVPTEIYEGLLSVFCIGAITIISFYGIVRGWRKVVGLLFSEYLFLIYCSTVFCRKTTEGVGHNFTPFWSYEAILHNGEDELITENVMNVLIFVPVGLMLSLLLPNGRRENEESLFGKCPKRYKEWLFATLVGLLLSTSIEALQFAFQLGFSEVDDVIHNTSGCLIGYILVKSTTSVCKIRNNYYKKEQYNECF